MFIYNLGFIDLLTIDCFLKIISVIFLYLFIHIYSVKDNLNNNEKIPNIKKYLCFVFVSALWAIELCSKLYYFFTRHLRCGFSLVLESKHSLKVAYYVCMFLFLGQCIDNK